MPLLDYCRYAQRMDASRRFAYLCWTKNEPDTSFEQFCSFWKAARELEAARKARAR